MKSYRKELWFNVPTRRAFVNITSQVEEALRESGIQEGFVLINTRHSQSALLPAVAAECPRPTSPPGSPHRNAPFSP
jgi:thiamine phosphate synthase YjbQ (UPF0047 family)